MESGIELVSKNYSNIQEPTVLVRNGCKHYGFKTQKVHVLQDLNMTVPKGVIYGLLGSSGCGKTTLLNCVVGRKQLNSGKIWVMGGVPGTKYSKVPGPRIGYMPQEAGVQYEFTTRETMKYFGEIAGLGFKKIEERIIFLEKLLMLPDLDKRLGNVSGGEQRRISFAVALLHEPELLILDEPTVGLDPLLRESIWNYLYDTTAQGKTTVIMTTHYIDEARHASVVALLRNGKLLSEEAPDVLLSKLSTNTLEGAFLTLSSQENHKTFPNNTLEFLSDNFDYDTSVQKNSDSVRPSNKSTSSHLIPLLRKNAQWLLKNPALIFLTIAVPILQLLVFHVAVGHDPTTINLAISNNETSLTNCSQITCDSDNLSCNFLEYLQTPQINLIYYDSKEKAVQTVFKGETEASLTFKHNYSTALKNRIISKNLTDWDVPYSNVHVVQDLTKYNIAIFTKTKIIEKFYNFVGDYLESCGYERNLLSLPIKWNQHIYGKEMPDFAEFAVPGLVLSGVSFFSAWAIASSVLTEFHSGITNRILVMGVNPCYLLLSHFISEMILIIFHIVAIVSFMFAVMKLTLHGSLILIILDFLLMSLWGMSFGILLATACSSDALATYILIGTYFPMGVLSGIIWPVEGMPYIIRKIATVLPFAGLADSMRSVSHRGWDLTHPQLYTSVMCVVIWILVFLILSVLAVKLKKK